MDDEVLELRCVDGKWRITGFLTAYEYAALFGVSESLVRKWIYQGKLDAVQVGKGWWVREGTPVPPNISRMTNAERNEYMRVNGHKLTETWHRGNGEKYRR